MTKVKLIEAHNKAAPSQARVPTEASDKLVQNCFEVSFFASLTMLAWNSNRLSKMELVDKIKGTIYGNCLGDAVGLATEFMTKEYAMRSYKRPLSFSKFVRDDHRSRWVAGDYFE